jgi:hypothetical protein
MIPYPELLHLVLAIELVCELSCMPLKYELIEQLLSGIFDLVLILLEDLSFLGVIFIYLLN